jgi:hypothetical protein
MKPGAHTPGPWMLHSEGSMRACDGRHQSHEGCRTLAEAEIVGIPRSEAEANARLIAAAPELLAALHQAVAIIRVFVDVDDTRWSHLRDAAELQAIEAAIAKAEGAR